MRRARFSDRAEARRAASSDSGGGAGKGRSRSRGGREERGSSEKGEEGRGERGGRGGRSSSSWEREEVVEEGSGSRMFAKEEDDMMVGNGSAGR